MVPTLRMQRQLNPWHSLNGQLNGISRPQANEVTAPDQGEGDNSWGMTPQVVLWPPHVHTCSHVHIGMYRERSSWLQGSALEDAAYRRNVG